MTTGSLEAGRTVGGEDSPHAFSSVLNSLKIIYFFDNRQYILRQPYRIPFHLKTAVLLKSSGWNSNWNWKCSKQTAYVWEWSRKRIVVPSTGMKFDCITKTKVLQFWHLRFISRSVIWKIHLNLYTEETIYIFSKILSPCSTNKIGFSPRWFLSYRFQLGAIASSVLHFNQNSHGSIKD